MKKEGILSAVKKIKEDPMGVVSKAVKHRQVYCVTKTRFFSTATPDEMTSTLVLYSGQEDREDVHRIIQARLR